MIFLSSLVLSQDAPLLQLRQQVVPKIRDEGDAGAPVDLGKQAVPVPLGAKDVPPQRRTLQFRLPFPGFFLRLRFWFAVPQKQGGLGVNAVVGELPLILFGKGVQL